MTNNDKKRGAAAAAAFVEKGSEVDLSTELERLRAENQALREAATGRWQLKVSAKGAVSAYGLGRWPTTLYKEQWEVVLLHADEIRSFIKAHATELKTRGQLSDG